MAKNNFRLDGVEEVVNRINKEVKDVKKGSSKGLIEASIVIRRGMEDTPPKTPVDTGNLRASWFTVTASKTPAGNSPEFKGKNASKMGSQHSSFVSSQKAEASTYRTPIVIMGFSANYTVYVHEKIEGTSSVVNTKNFASKEKERRPGSGAKFFEASLKRNRPEIVKLIKENAEI